jgi:H+-translocating NAD(P) transhydrogenase subunit alpha
MCFTRRRIARSARRDVGPATAAARHGTLGAMILTMLKAPPPERRLALVPQVVERLAALGHTVRLPRGIGASLAIADDGFEKAGAEMVDDAASAARDADLVLVVQPPSERELGGIGDQATVVGFLDPFFNHALVRALAERKMRSLCVELMPRTTIAQKMDALSSQASLAGYAAVLAAAERIDKAFPMMTTPAGTIPPARVFVIGVGVAGLQAIATAKRLGARVEAYDTRPVVEEQVRSLGARFVTFDVGETGQTEQGYAKALTDEQLARQREQMAKVVAGSDVVITTAQVFGRRAPRLLGAAEVRGMRPGAVVVDLAAGSGGNVEGSVSGEEVWTDEGVLIIGSHPMAMKVARDASLMYANNLMHLVAHAYVDGELRAPEEDDIVNGVLLTEGGTVRNAAVREAVEGSGS